jgi:hypothetical protein
MSKGVQSIANMINDLCFFAHTSMDIAIWHTIHRTRTNERSHGEWCEVEVINSSPHCDSLVSQCCSDITHSQSKGPFEEHHCKTGLYQNYQLCGHQKSGDDTVWRSRVMAMPPGRYPASCAVGPARCVLGCGMKQNHVLKSTTQALSPLCRVK